MNAIGTQLRDPVSPRLTPRRMVVLNIKMDAAPELGRNPVSKHYIPPEYGDEQADAGRDCQTRLARPDSQARTRTTGEILIFPDQLTTNRIGNLTRLIRTLAICNDHTAYSNIYMQHNRIILLYFSTINTRLPKTYRGIFCKYRKRPQPPVQQLPVVHLTCLFAQT